MKAAVVAAFGKPPVFGEFRDPLALPGEAIVSVSASALSPLTKARAGGTHYSATTAELPFIPGIDGVGRLKDGRRVYFLFPGAPFGGLGERVPVSENHFIPVPDDVDDVTAAAIANPGMSVMAALTERTRLQRGETVLVNGATGSAGRLAVQIAKHLGAKKVIATGRNAEMLVALSALGADATISLEQSREALDASLSEQFYEGVDVVLDYLWGWSAESIVRAVADGRSDVTVRFVQLGSVSGETIALSAGTLRSSGLELMGSGIGSVSDDALLRSIERVFRAAVPAGLKIETRTAPLSDIEAAWKDASSARTVIFI